MHGLHCHSGKNFFKFCEFIRHVVIIRWCNYGTIVPNVGFNPRAPVPVKKRTNKRAAVFTAGTYLLSV